LLMNFMSAKTANGATLYQVIYRRA